MCYLFEGNKSPSTCNYALRETALDNVNQYSHEAGSTIIRNANVDNILKSSKDSQTTLKLTVNVKGVYVAGSFKMTKFNSSFREVSEKLPEEDISKEVKDLDLTVQLFVLVGALKRTRFV